MPTVVYVKFDGATWQLDGTDEPGIYPVYPIKATWYLDRRRERPVLAVKRRQLPLVPAFAVTAHGSQGKTKPAVMVDLNVDKRTDSRFGTVVCSRVACREDVLILRPFPLWLYQRGASEGPQMLLRHLRGEDIDWATYRETLMPVGSCQTCQQVRPMDAFSSQQWGKIRSNLPGVCLRCVHTDGGATTKRKVAAGAKFKCMACHLHKVEHAFPRAQLAQEDAAAKRQCLTCRRQASRLTCSICQRAKPTEDFHKVMITMPSDNVACKSCQDRFSGGGTSVRS